MNQFKEKMGSIFLMNERNEAQYEVTEPAMLLDKDLFVLYKIGNRKDVLRYYEQCIEKCNKTGSNLFESWVVMDLPLDVALLDKILQGSSHLETIIKNDLQLNIEF